LILLVFVAVSCGNNVHKGEIQDPDEDLLPDRDEAEDPDENDDSYHDAAQDDEVLFNLKVTENEKNLLSCGLTFSTKEERKTFVKYYSEVHAGYKIVEDSAKTEHYFFLWGMRENNNYKIEIYSDETEPELLATAEFRSSVVPASFAAPHVVKYDKKRAQPGFLILAQQSLIRPEDMKAEIFMVDNEGFIIWYYQHYVPGYALLGDPMYHENTRTISMGIQKGPNMGEIPAEDGIEIDLEGNLVWKSPDFYGYTYSETTWHHQYSVLDDGTVLFIKPQIQNQVIADRIVNVDRDYNELWNWGYFDLPDYFNNITCADPDNDWCDWTHTNSVMMFKDENLVYFNSLWLGFYKLDMNTKKILWNFGKNGDFRMLSEHENPWPDGSHAPEFYDASKKRVVFFDNGMKERNYSRIIEYEIDEEAMTAAITFEYDGKKDGRGWWARNGWGDVDYLENGNILVTKGQVDPPDNSSVFEVTHDGEVVWELYTRQDESVSILLYNVFKFVPPLESLE